MRKKRRRVFFIIGVLMLSIIGGATVCAEDSEEKESITMFKKNLRTGEEFTEDITISEDEIVLNAESYFGNTPLFPPRIIIGENEMYELPDYELDDMPYSSIGRVRVTFEDGSVSNGTGFLFGPNDVATAAHVVYNEDGFSATSIRFWFPDEDESVYTGTDLTIPLEYKQAWAPGYDWAMFHINSNIGNSRGYLGWTGDISVNTTVQVIGFPGNRLVMAGKQVKSVTNALIRYDVDTLPGQSGSPVLNRALNNKIVAIHTGGYEGLQLNEGSRVTARMASVLNEYRNE